MKTTIRNFLGIAVLMLLSCSILSNQSNQSTPEPKDTFYTKAFYLGDPRLPLIKPYDAQSPDHSFWLVGMFDRRQGGAGSVSQLDVKDGVIFIYCSGETSLYGKGLPEVWFIIQPAKEIEIGFENEAEFKAYLSEQGISEPEWKDIQTVWENFRDTGELPWKTD